ncbi:hypothetical protein ACIG3E_20580 [Streptomyces sp. NPDC053474]|uniref:hypothetical protein n=1 Tax=Streptomyces sp. NPDC053474 TaxID=3365704 RepID=UPI0037D21630
MTSDEARSGLPIAFLHVIAAEAAPGSPPIRMAAERARELPAGSDRDDLLLALLLGALSDSAPEWMLQAAVDGDLQKETPSYLGPSMRLAAAALDHPSCTDMLREDALRRCSVPQLGILGRERCSEVLARMIVAELQGRGPHGQPMTPELLKEPSAAQLILREAELHDAVFFAALDLLPERPRPSQIDRSEADGVTGWFDKYMAARDAWESMWEHVVTRHTRRHRQLVTWAEDGMASRVIRRHLLGTVPWDVEPSLLEEVADDDLARFTTSELITRMSRLVRDGVAEQEVRSRFADELDALGSKNRRHVDSIFDDSTDELDYGLRAAVSWVEAAADSTWRYILAPAEAKPRYGEPHTWLASDELLASLGQRFAATAVKALRLWEPDSQPSRPTPRDLRWVHAMLLHLPHVSEEVKGQARAVVRHIRPRPRGRWELHDFAEQRDGEQLTEIHAAIERILGDPATAARKWALGDPEQVTVADLSRASAEVLLDYLDRHTGNDTLVEKALLSFASYAYRPELSFSDVLARHSTPETALLQITTNLRKHLGGGPPLRETWARQVLALQDCTPELIRALPAWTALTVGGDRYSNVRKAVAAVVLSALGDSDEAWARFASSPASYAGPTAWLRLGDVLDAAAHGTGWPKPPGAKWTQMPSSDRQRVPTAN